MMSGMMMIFPMKVQKDWIIAAVIVMTFPVKIQ